MVTILAAFTVMGIGIDIAETLNDLILASVPAHKAGAASAISATAYETGSVLGTAVIGSVLTATYNSRLEVPIAVAGADPAHFGTLGSTLDYAATPGGLGRRGAGDMRDRFRRRGRRCAMPREVIPLTVELLFTADDDGGSQPNVLRQVYDPAAGTCRMLSVADEWLREFRRSSPTSTSATGRSRWSGR